MFESTANSECMEDTELKDENPKNFGIIFDPKGNFTFTYGGAVAITQLLPHLN